MLTNRVLQAQHHQDVSNLIVVDQLAAKESTERYLQYSVLLSTVLTLVCPMWEPMGNEPFSFDNYDADPFGRNQSSHDHTTYASVFGLHSRPVTPVTPILDGSGSPITGIGVSRSLAASPVIGPLRLAQESRFLETSNNNTTLASAFSHQSSSVLPINDRSGSPIIGVSRTMAASPVIGPLAQTEVLPMIDISRFLEISNNNTTLASAVSHQSSSMLPINGRSGSPFIRVSRSASTVIGPSNSFSSRSVRSEHSADSDSESESMSSLSTYDNSMEKHARRSYAMRSEHSANSDSESESMSSSSTYGNSMEKKVSRKRQYHTTDRTFRCDECDMNFPFKCYLNDHFRSEAHSDERPFACDAVNCNERFAYKRGLESHKRSHSNIRKFKCKKCKFSTHQSCNLTAHMRIHSGVKPFACEYCDFHSAQKQNVTAHMKTKHGFGRD